MRLTHHTRARVSAANRVQLRELKNGCLAMIAIAAFFVQENLTGQGPIEHIYGSGHVNPSGDGQGVF
ncbi:hypothetical protein JKP88DRAFT_274908 [Tribonema minus]|uniref:Uncharacterized protein n=1 Tax=Tribonema minus TaxID=303371 RepID=A0A836CMK5_9STRA|nr:hypothetical protein JKP88DRAFT_274908 [Tribonema minus]